MHPRNSSCFELVAHQRSAYPSFCWYLTSKQMPKPSNTCTLLTCCPLVRTPRGSGDFVGCRSAVLRTIYAMVFFNIPLRSCWYLTSKINIQTIQYLYAADMLPLGEDTKGIRRLCRVPQFSSAHPIRYGVFNIPLRSCWCLTSKVNIHAIQHWTLLICCPLVRTPRGSGSFVGCRSSVLRTIPTLLLKRTPSLKKAIFLSNKTNIMVFF
jgi:hypothetical protein